MASDSDYARRLAIGPDDSIWVGTGALNPRIFTFAASSPDQVTEIKLPNPVPNGFISTIEIVGQQLLTTASGLPHGILFDIPSGKWIKELPPTWATRNVSDEYRGENRIYTVIKNRLHALNTTTWNGLELGPVSTNKTKVLIPNPKQVIVIGSNAHGLLLEYFDLASNSVVETHSIKLVASEYKIQSLMAHSDGNIYIGGYMGKGLAAIDPDSGGRWQSPANENLVNQIEGMIEYSPGRSYIGSYGSADIIGLDMQLRDSPDR